MKKKIQHGLPTVGPFLLFIVPEIKFQGLRKNYDVVGLLVCVCGVNYLHSSQETAVTKHFYVLSYIQGGSVNSQQTYVRLDIHWH